MSEERRAAPRFTVPEGVAAEVGGVPAKLLELSMVGAKVEHFDRFPLTAPQLSITWKGQKATVPVRVARSEIVGRRAPFQPLPADHQLRRCEREALEMLDLRPDHAQLEQRRRHPADLRRDPLRHHKSRRRAPLVGHRAEFRTMGELLCGAQRHTEAVSAATRSAALPTASGADPPRRSGPCRRS